MKFIVFKFKPHVGKWSCNSLIQFNLERFVLQRAGRQFTPQVKLFCRVVDSGSLTTSVSFLKHRGPGLTICVSLTRLFHPLAGLSLWNTMSRLQLGAGHTPSRRLR